MPPALDDPAVREQQGDPSGTSVPRWRSPRLPGVGRGVVDFRLQAGPEAVLAGQRAAADEDGVVGQQDRVEVHPRQAHRARPARTPGSPLVRSTMAVLPAALLASPGPPPRIMTFWSRAGGNSTLGGLLAAGRIVQAGHAGDGDRVGGQVHQHRSLRVWVVHPAAGEEHPAVVQAGTGARTGACRRTGRPAGPAGHARCRCLGRRLEGRVQRPVLVQPADRQHAPVGQRQQGGVPASRLDVTRWCHCWVTGSKPTALARPLPG